MANINRPRGLIPVGAAGNGSYHGILLPVFTPSSDGTAYGIGDILKADGTAGTAGTVVNGVNVEGMLECIKNAAATTGQDWVGVVVGFVPNPTDAMVGTVHRKASTARVALVAPFLPGSLFEVQEDPTTHALAATDIGSNVGIVVGSVSTTTGMSGTLLDSNTVNTTNTLPLRIVGLVPRVDNAFNTAGVGAATDPAKVLVTPNTSWWMPNITSV